MPGLFQYKCISKYYCLTQFFESAKQSALSAQERKCPKWLSAQKPEYFKCISTLGAQVPECLKCLSALWVPSECPSTLWAAKCPLSWWTSCYTFWIIIFCQKLIMRVKVHFIYIKRGLVGKKYFAKISAKIQLFYNCNNIIHFNCNTTI